MSISTTQPIASRPGLLLAGSLALTGLSGRDDVQSGSGTVAGLPVVGAHRTWDDGTVVRGDGTPRVTPLGMHPANNRLADNSLADIYLADSYPAGVSTDLFEGKDVIRFESTKPSDIRVTTRGIPV